MLGHLIDNDVLIENVDDPDPDYEDENYVESVKLVSRLPSMPVDKDESTELNKPTKANTVKKSKKEGNHGSTNHKRSTTSILENSTAHSSHQLSSGKK